MPYPPKVDPQNKTWVIAFDFKLTRLKHYCEENMQDGDDCKAMLNSYRTQIFNEFYRIVEPYGFSYRMQNSLVYNNSTDATKAFKAVSLGIKKSWTKYFIEKIHLFEIDPNSDASDLLELDTVIEAANRPDWITDGLLGYISSVPSDESEEW